MLRTAVALNAAISASTQTSCNLPTRMWGLVEAFWNWETKGMLYRRDDSPRSERRAARPPAALVIDGRGSTGVTS